MENRPFFPFSIFHFPFFCTYRGEEGDGRDFIVVVVGGGSGGVVVVVVVVVVA